MATHTDLARPEGYTEFLQSLKARVREAQAKAQRVVNTQLIELYWGIGSAILSRQTQGSWGTGVIRQLSEDLRIEFAELTGLSYRNLQYMRAFAVAWPSKASAQHPAAQFLSS